MENSDTKLSGSAEEIEWFVSALRNVRANRNSAAGWEALRCGTYLGGQTESQIRNRGVGGLGNLNEEQWNTVAEWVKADERAREVQRNLALVREQAINAHLDLFLETQFGAASISERAELRRLIDQEAYHERFEELEEFLRKIHADGFKKAKREWSRSNHLGGSSVYFLYVMPMIAAVIEITVSLFVLHFVSAGFQTIGMAMLLLIYAALRSTRDDLQQKSIFQINELRRLSSRTFSLLRYDPEKLTAESEQQLENNRALQRTSVKILIRVIQLGIIELIAIFAIIKTVI